MRSEPPVSWSRFRVPPTPWLPADQDESADPVQPLRVLAADAGDQPAASQAPLMLTVPVPPFVDRRRRSAGRCGRFPTPCRPPVMFSVACAAGGRRGLPPTLSTPVSPAKRIEAIRSSPSACSSPRADSTLPGPATSCRWPGFEREPVMVRLPAVAERDVGDAIGVRRQAQTRLRPPLGEIAADHPVRTCAVDRDVTGHVPGLAAVGAHRTATVR